jgi:DNA-binding transcriptional MerR regulator
MRIAELSERSGVPVHTIKFYRREGLLPAGTLSAANQADYSEDHLRRLNLIRALVGVGGLSLQQVHKVIAALENDDLSTFQLLGVASYALLPDPPLGAEQRRSVVEVQRFLEMRGWRVFPGSPAVFQLADALDAIGTFWGPIDAEALTGYADVIEPLAEHEAGTIDLAASRDELVDRVVVGTVLWEVVLTSLRRMAQEHFSRTRAGL